MRTTAAGSREVLLRALGDARLRRAGLAFGGFGVAEYGTWVAVLVYAYERAGTTGAAMVAVAQLLPAAIAAPLIAAFADRRGSLAALRWGYATQGLALAATAALIAAGAPVPLVYATAMIAASAVTAIRPAHAALLPSLTRDPPALTAATVLSGWLDSVSVLIGPALAGGLMALDGPAAALGCFGLLNGLAVLLLRDVDVAAIPRGSDEAAGDQSSAVEVLRADGGLSALVALLGAQYVVIGALDVLEVVLAVSVLGLGASGAGYLAAAFGAGGVLGSLASVLLIGRVRLAGPLLAATGGWALLLAMLGVWPGAISAFLLLGATGAARSLVDVAGRTMLLRAAPRGVRARVFGLLESASMLGLALGSILVPVLIGLGGAGTALVAIGLLLAAVGLAGASLVLGLENGPVASRTRQGRRLQSADARHHAA